jgi:hypothetical protein
MVELLEGKIAMLQRTMFSWRPALLPRTAVLAQSATPPASPSETGRTVGAVIGHAVSGAIGAGTAWVGFDTGARREGFLSFMGYLVGVGGALSAVVDVAALGLLAYKAVTGKALLTKDDLAPYLPKP